MSETFMFSSKEVERRPNETQVRKVLPRHLVIIPDGNGRWARKHNLPVGEGHLRGAEQMLKLADRVEQLGIEVCTFWGFSTENWSRGPEEVEKIFQITLQMLKDHGDEWVAKGRRFKHVGRKDRLPLELMMFITSLEERTQKSAGQTFVLALDYGGRDEIVRAVKKAEGTQIDEISFLEFLDTAGLPEPDLIIRTSEEYRTSGIYPYQAVYAEYVSSPVYFPDFDDAELVRCIDEFAKRKRRFGARRETLSEQPFGWLDLPQPNFSSFANSVLPHIELATQTLIENWRKGLFYKSSFLQEDVDVYQQLLRGGKKLRAALVVLGFENYGGEAEYREGVFTAAAGFEVLHNAFLIHDDIEDNSSLRRGGPSVHEGYRLKHQASKKTALNSAQYGRAIALNTGNLGAVKVQEMLWNIDNKQSRIIRAQKLVRDIVETVMLGQRRDLSEVLLNQLTKRNIYQIYHQKTAYYTVSGPLMLGAVLAGCSQKEASLLDSFGVNLGIAFQLIDDHLGLYGSQEVIGKPVGSDIAEAKKTLHFMEAWKRATVSQRHFLESVWGRQNLTEEEILAVRKLVDALGARDYVLKTAEKLAQKAKGIIPKIATSEVSLKIFQDLTDFVVKREF